MENLICFYKSYTIQKLISLTVNTILPPSFFEKFKIKTMYVFIVCFIKSFLKIKDLI